jgi:hypothetical protein
MSDLTEKYQQLNEREQKEGKEGRERMLSRKNQAKSSSSGAGYKEKLMKVSQWSDDDLKVFEQNRKLFNNWKAAEW